MATLKVTNIKNESFAGDQLYLKTDGKIGIGTTSPTELLDVEGTIECLNELRSKTGNDLKLNAGSANRDVFLQVNDSTLMTVQGSTGKVGIGVTSPIGKLHIVEPTEGNTVIQLNSGDGYPGVNRNLTIKSGTGGWAGAKWIFDAVSSGGQLDFQTTSQSRLLIDQNGNVNIGTTSAFNTNTKLNVAPTNRTSAFSASDGDTWHDVVLKQTGDNAANAVGIAFEISTSAYHKNAGTGIACVKNGTAGDYGSDLVLITRPQSSIAVERMRIKSDGDIEVGGNLKTNNLPGRNLIINGAFQIAQRATTNNTAGASSTYHTLDRWLTQIQAGTITESQQSLSSSDTGPWGKGLRHYMRILNQSGIGGGAAQYAEIDQIIEAQNIAQSGWDYTDSAKYITLSFWIRASVAQSYTVVMYTSDGTGRHFPFQVALSANTWTKVTKAIPGYSGITFNNDNGNGIRLTFIAAYGTNYTDNSAGLDSWQTTGNGLTRFPDVTTTWATTTNATFDLTGVQLEVGSIATEFEHRSYGEELLRCQRYYHKLKIIHSHGQFFTWTSYGSTDQRSQTIYYPTTMRDQPVFSYENTFTNYQNLGLGGAISAFYLSDSGSNLDSTSLRITTADTITSGLGGICRGNNTTAGYFEFNSEL